MVIGLKKTDRSTSTFNTILHSANTAVKGFRFTGLKMSIEILNIFTISLFILLQIRSRFQEAFFSLVIQCKVLKKKTKKKHYAQWGETMVRGSRFCPLMIGQGLKYGNTASLNLAW